MQERDNELLTEGMVNNVDGHCDDEDFNAKEQVFEKLIQLEQLINIKPVVDENKRFPSLDRLMETLNPMIESQLNRIEFELNGSCNVKERDTRGAGQNVKEWKVSYCQLTF
jgi:hypothetical protein